MKAAFYRLAGLALLLWLGACTALPQNSQGRDYFPGGSPYYSFGVSQSKENFANIQRAQSDYGLYAKNRSWGDITPGSGAYILGLQAYFSLHVRWQLKDGRQFIAENIDVREIMREYFKNHDIKLPWKKEGRSREAVGDSDPSLVHEVKGDEVIIKWLITTNRTPINERIAPSGAANKWHFTKEEFIVTAIKGTPASGIDFNNRRDNKN